jgi:hypothetical protein
MHVNVIIVFCPAYDLRNVRLFRPVTSWTRIQTFHTYVCPFRVDWHLPVDVSHILTVLSPLPLATFVPSGDHATDQTL